MSNFGVGAALAVVGLWVAAIAGWVMNIIKIIPLVSDGFTAELVVRLVGVPVAIIGMIYGWF